MPATTTASETTLTPLQLQVLGYLADGASMVDITGVTQVHRNTISNWRNHNPAFARELLNATRNRALEFRDRAETLVPKAIRVLDAILDNDRVSPSVRLRAALAVLKMAQPVLTREPAEGVEAREEIEAATIALPQNPKILHNAAQPPVRLAVQPGRNTTCPCGSGLKFKCCCAMKPPTRSRLKSRRCFDAID